MSRLEIALLGPPEIKIDNTSAQTDRRKAIALLAYLVVTGKSHTRDHLAGFLWPDYERDSAYAYLRRTLWELNQILGKGWIDADRERVALAQSPDLWLDTAAFQELTHAGPGGVADVTRATHLYRGDFLSGFTVADTTPFEDWQFQQAEYFRREFARALDSLVEIHTQAGEHEPALPYAHRWLALDPLNETAHRAILRLLAGMGDRTGAIRQYETCVQTLQDELGIEPQSETTELFEAILRGDIRAGSFGDGRKPPSAQDATSPGPVTSYRPAHARPAPRLPVLPTPFIGRRPEVEQVKSLIHNPGHHLITMIGPGGTGKTRLSIQAASEVTEAFPDGVFFTPLASVQTAEAVLPAIAKALDFSFYQEEDSRKKQLLDYLREKQLLLVLDNFEHVMEAAPLVNDILVNAAGVKQVVTSRVRLNVRGEQLYTVTGMRTPTIEDASHWDDPEAQAEPFSGVQLFLDSGHRARASFSLTKENLVPVLEICRLVQGMPLALELAAAWLELLSPEEIAEEIRRSLDFLETDQTGVPDRQRSIRAVFESSWKLLSEAERAVFLRLCVFVGSFSREAAQAVSGASLRTLLGLANKSWLQQTEDGRFQLHELMRQYGEERLRADEAAWREAKDRHTDFFADYVAEQAIKLTGSEQPAGLEAVELEFDSNIKSAFDWLVAEQRWRDLIERIALGLFQFNVIRWRVSEMVLWYREARLAFTAADHDGEQLEFAIISTLDLINEAANSGRSTDSLKGFSELYQLIVENDLDESMGFWFSIVAGLANFWNVDVDLDERFERHINRLRENNRLWELGYSLGLQGGWWQEHSFDEDKLNEALRIFKQIGAIYEASAMYQKLGNHAFLQKRPIAEIMGFFDEARKLFESFGDDPFGGGVSWEGLAGIYIQQGEIEKGFELLRGAQHYVEKKGNIKQLINYLNWEALHAVRYSTIDHALGVRLRSLALARKQNIPIDLAWPLLELGDIYRISGDFAKARESYDEAMPIFESISEYLGLGYRQRGLGDIAIQTGNYADALAHYEKYLTYATQRYHLWSIGQAHGKLAFAHAQLGNVNESRLELQKSLRDLQDWPENQLYVLVLLAEPVCLIHEKKPEQALELAALIAHHPASWYETKKLARAILETASRGLPDEVVQAAIERGKGLELETVVSQFLED